MYKKIIYSVLLCAALSLSSLCFGYYMYRPKAEEPAPRVDIHPKRGITAAENATAEYIYKYLGDGITETSAAPIPPYLAGLTEQEAREKMRGFDITYFSENKITLVKELAGESRQHYIIGEKDGYVAVYYKKGGGLKEVTNTPTAVLGSEYADLAGCEIVGKEALAGLLQDIES